jgi:phosphoribosyl 1,2-cyclic phosphodiesterase
VVLEQAGRRPIVLDLGTGLRFFGMTQPQDGSFDGIALVSHLHWDHVQGLPFFSPVLAPGARLDLYAPAPDDGTSLSDAIHTFLAPPFFPVTVDALPGTFTFTEVRPGTFSVDGAEVTVAEVPHVGATVGYRVERDGVSIAYVSDHQQPGCGRMEVDPGVLELCRGVDLLIHDAQYTADEFATRPDWGHCTVEYAVNVAAQAGVRRLALFHHDPLHSDAVLDELGAFAGRLAARSGVREVIVAAEGLKVSLTAGGAR